MFSSRRCKSTSLPLSLFSTFLEPEPEVLGKEPKPREIPMQDVKPTRVEFTCRLFAFGVRIQHTQSMDWFMLMVAGGLGAVSGTE